jgi:WhiB family redox-sensing transcriptional regulator
MDTDERPHTWYDDAACRGRDPGDFVIEPTGNQKETMELHAAAMRTCAHCPVTAECLQFALLHDERVGVWGGTTPRQRRELKRKLLQGQLVFVQDEAGRLGTLEVDR